MSDYIDGLSVEQLRRQLERSFDERNALNRDLCDLPVVPSIDTLSTLTHAAMNLRAGIDLQGIGNRLQRENDGIPYKCEYERAAGLWSVIRDGIIAAMERD